MNNFSFIFCLAGKGSRFVSRGYDIPKFLLPLPNGRTILEQSLISMNMEFCTELLVVLNEDLKHHSNRVEEIIKQFCASSKVILTGNTIGQAETAAIGANNLSKSQPFFIFNGDTILLNRKVGDYSKFLNLGDNKLVGFIDRFKSNSLNYSYIQSSSGNIVSKIAEKMLISNSATSGLYGFSSPEIYLNNYDDTNFASNEFYVSDIYNKLINENYLIKTGQLFSSKETIVLGTPEEYEKNKFKFV